MVDKWQERFAMPAPVPQKAFQDALRLLAQVREACLFADDNGTIGVTQDPHLPIELFNEINDLLKEHTRNG